MIERTAIVFAYPNGHEAHMEQGHPERPERVEAIVTALTEKGWWQPFPQVEQLDLPEAVLLKVHDATYLKQLQRVCQVGGRLDADTYTRRESWDLALQAGGQAAAVAAFVWDGRAAKGFALTRPPGHHATPTRGMGFCLLNNIALAAEYLVQMRGARRLAILDFDLHHGNGTQAVFYQRGDVFYLSTHQAPFYPGTGALQETGAGDGALATANLPLPAGSGDGAFAALGEHIAIPLLERYKPEMVLVSYGFDTHWRDPLGSLQLSAAGYGRLIGTVAEWADEHCGGKLALFLEGGYDLEAAAACSLAVTAALLGETANDPLGPAPWPERGEWRAVLASARERWGLA